MIQRGEFRTIVDRGESPCTQNARSNFPFANRVLWVRAWSGLNWKIGIRSMDLELKGKLALVSGSTAGIGLAIATTFAREGARVIINGRAQASVDDAVTELRSRTGGSVEGFAGDLSKPSSAEELGRRHPGVEILVNNLGIFEPNHSKRFPMKTG
jgi:short chain dehydrogenase